MGSNPGGREMESFILVMVFFFENSVATSSDSSTSMRLCLPFCRRPLPLRVKLLRSPVVAPALPLLPFFLPFVAPVEVSAVASGVSSFFWSFCHILMKSLSAAESLSMATFTSLPFISKTTSEPSTRTISAVIFFPAVLVHSLAFAVVLSKLKSRTVENTRYKIFTSKSYASSVFLSISIKGNHKDISAAKAV